MSKKKEDQPKIHLPKEQSVQFSRTNTDMLSYEGLWIAQYLQELRKTKGEMRKKKEVPRSPYAQCVYSGSEYKYSKRRPMSATYPARTPSGYATDQYPYHPAFRPDQQDHEQDDPS